MSRVATIDGKLLAAMAYNREAFKDKVEEKVGGALLEYYKAHLARQAGQRRWVEHWDAEVTRLLDTELVVVLLHSIKGFKDRRKAAAEVLRQLRSMNPQYQRAAAHVVQRDYGLKRVPTQVASEITEQFFEKVQAIVETHA
jgi:hypothetical protein